MLRIIIVTWNSARFIRDCLASIPVDYHAQAVVIDNHSTDTTAEIVRSEFPAVRLLVNEQNTGYAHANNQAIGLLSSSVIRYPLSDSGSISVHQRSSAVDTRESPPVYSLQPTTYLLLNPDTRLPPSGIAAMVDYLEAHPDVSVLAPRLVNSDGSPQPSVRRFPTYGNMLRSLFGLRSDYRLPDFDHTRIQDVEQPMASCLLIRRDALEAVGLFDEQFPFFMNDVDLLKRIHDAGRRIVYYPEVAVWHYVGGSTEQARTRMIWSVHQSLYRYFRKHDHSGWFWLKAIPLALVIEAVALVRALAVALKRNRPKPQASSPNRKQ